MTYGNIYVAKVSLSNPAQTVKAFLEADAYDGPSLILAYSHCIAHGIDMTTAVDTCRQAVASGHWPLFRYNPALAAAGQNPLQFDSPEPSLTFSEYALKQNRYRMLQKADPETSAALMKVGNRVTASRFDLYRKLAEIQTGFSSGE
jgi:pyruvate-ferredoxin/flavodoxin oxidoreductase